MQEINRKSNYDFLRLIAMIGVIVNHTSDTFIFLECEHKSYVYLFEALGAFSVSAFLMITGAFVIDNFENRNYKEFYRKKFYKLVIHGLIFSVYYAFWTFYVLHNFIGIDFRESIRHIFSRQITGWFGHPMWYVYAMIGIYFIIPLIVDLKYKYGEKPAYHIFAVIYCIWAFLSMYMDEGAVSWSVPLVFEFLGFVVLGSEIKYFLKNKENNLWSILLILTGFLVYIAEYAILYLHVQNGGEYYTRYLNSRVAPLSLLGVILIFSGICILSIRVKFNMVAKYSFFVYLFHKSVLEFLVEMIDRGGYVLDVRIYILLVATLTFVISLILSVVYLHIYEFLKNKITALNKS